MFDKNSAMTDRRIINLLGDERPWWLWSLSCERVFLSNHAGTREMGAIGTAITSERLYSPRHPFAAKMIAEAKQFTNAGHVFSLTLKNGSDEQFIMSKILFSDGSEAFLIESQESAMSFTAFSRMADAIDDPIMLFEADGSPKYVNSAAGNLEGLTLPDLLGNEGATALRLLEQKGEAKFSLVTGALYLTKHEALGIIFAGVSPQKLPTKPVKAKPIAEASSGLRLVVTNDPPPVEQKIAPTPMVAKQQTALARQEDVQLHIEDDDMIIDGTMPVRNHFDLSHKKLLRFVWSSDAEHRLTSASPELMEIVGEEFSDLAGKTWRDLLSSTIIDPENALLKALEKRETKSGHSTLWKVQGQLKLAKIDIAALPVFDRSRGFMGYRGFGLFKDYVQVDAVVNKPITTKALSDEEVKNFNTVATVLKATLPKPKTTTKDAVVIYLGNEIFHVNERFLKLTGFSSREEFDQAGGTARLFAGRHLGEEANENFTLTHKKGHDLAVSVRLTKTEWEGNSALKMLIEPNLSIPVLDVPAKILPTPIKNQQSTPIDFIQNLSFPTIIINEKGRIESVNSAFIDLLQGNKTTYIDKAFSSIVASESHRQAEDYVTSLLENGVRSVINEGRELLFRAKDGSVKPLFMMLSLHNNDVTGKIIAQFVDTSGFKGNSTKLAEVEQISARKTAFLAEISHEIRTPLNAIIGFSESMKEERFGALNPEQYRGYASDIHAAGTHILTLVNDLLDLSKIESGKAALSFEATDVNLLLDESLALMQDQAEKAKIIIRKALTRPLPHVLSDKRALKQILLNLMSNALKFTPKGGQIILTTLVNEAGEVVIRLRDTGIGMTKEQISIALAPWQQPHQHKGGSGLGLPIIKALADANRCEFALTSSEGQGTLAEIIFPQMRIL